MCARMSPELDECARTVHNTLVALHCHTPLRSQSGFDFQPRSVRLAVNPLPRPSPSGNGRDAQVTRTNREVGHCDDLIRTVKVRKQAPWTPHLQTAQEQHEQHVGQCLGTMLAMERPESEGFFLSPRSGRVVGPDDTNYLPRERGRSEK